MNSKKNSDNALKNVVGLTLLCLSFFSQADFAGKILDPSTGYSISFNSMTSLSKTPVQGSDGYSYYQVGGVFVVNTNSINVTKSGEVDCDGTTWPGDLLNNTTTADYAGYARHRLFVYLPPIGTIDGWLAYRVNENMYVSIKTDKGLDGQWASIMGAVCSKPLNRAPVSDFTAHFPFSVRFYIRERTVEGQLPVPNMVLAGYVRAFTKDINSIPASWAPTNVTVPLHLKPGVINFPASCTTTTSSGSNSNLNLQHGALSALNYDNTQTGKITYNCDFSKSTSVKLRLAYTADGQQVGVPMTDTTTGNKIYTELVIIDDETQQSGSTINTQIHTQKTFTVRSHLQGQNAQGGNYTGAAWIIATYN